MNLDLDIFDSVSQISTSKKSINSPEDSFVGHHDHGSANNQVGNMVAIWGIVLFCM